MSTKRWITLSIQPPKYAEAAPRIAPTVEPMNDDMKPITSAVRAP